MRLTTLKQRNKRQRQVEKVGQTKQVGRGKGNKAETEASLLA